MEKLLSTLCIHKRANGKDNRFSGFDRLAVVDPLRNILGATECGRIRQSEGKPYAYVSLKDMWSEEIEEMEAPNQLDTDEAEETGDEPEEDSSDDKVIIGRPAEQYKEVPTAQPEQEQTITQRPEPQPAVAKARNLTSEELLERLNAPDSSEDEWPARSPE